MSSELIFLMESKSDNSASLWCQELAGGGAAINSWLAAKGWKATRVNSRTPGREKERETWGWGQTTPREMAELLVAIRERRAVSPRSRRVRRPGPRGGLLGRRGGLLAPPVRPRHLEAGGRQRLAFGGPARFGAVGAVRPLRHHEGAEGPVVGAGERRLPAPPEDHGAGLGPFRAGPPVPAVAGWAGLALTRGRRGAGRFFAVPPALSAGRATIRWLRTGMPPRGCLCWSPRVLERGSARFSRARSSSASSPGGSPARRRPRASTRRRR